MPRPNIIKQPQPKSNLFGLLGPYRQLIIVLVVFTVGANALTLWLPRLLSNGIDGYVHNSSLTPILWKFSIASFFIFIFTYIQNIVQAYASERVARDLRNRVSEKISTFTFAQVEQITPARLLTNLTSDIDSVKNFVSQGVANVVSSVFLLIGGSILLISVNWKLGLAVVATLPIIGITFTVIFGKVRKLFIQSREVIDWMNKVISESIIGAALVRVLQSQKVEHEKFSAAIGKARNVGINILKLFSAMIPIVTFVSNFAILIILVLGGKFVIGGSMSLGDFASFNSYLTILIFPIFILGFVSNIMAQAQASYQRVAGVLDTPVAGDEGTVVANLQGSIEVKNVSLFFGEKPVVKDVSFTIKPGQKVAIIGPTAAGKSQLLNLLVGLTQPTSGQILYDGRSLTEYQKNSLYKQIGLVFQDSIIFNMSIRENIAFNKEVTDFDLQKAIETAELADFITKLPSGLDAIVSERGTSLSGGQKQRIMLARALAMNPRVLLLDDFTARVDASTENKILNNVAQNYPQLTLVSVTQKIASVENYDQIIVLLEGEVIASGTHQALLDTSTEYAQIYESQQSTTRL